MFGLNPGIGRASENFYRNLFALAAFIAFAAALLTDSPISFAATVIFGTLSRTAVKKNWKNPAFARRLSWLVRRTEEHAERQEEK